MQRLTKPDPTLLGAAIMIASGVYLLHRERVTWLERRKAEAAAAAPTAPAQAPSVPRRD